MELIERDLATEPHHRIAAADLVCAEAVAGEAAITLRRRAAIEYTAEWHDRIPGSRLFWGPYIGLCAGVYLLEFTGRLEGELSVDFAYRAGRNRLKTATIADFGTLVCLVLTHPIEDLEVRGIKTRALRRLSLGSIAVYRTYVAPGDDPLK